MNKDLDRRLIPSGEYINAINAQISMSEGDGVGTLENILGNELIANIEPTIPNLFSIGYYVDQINNFIYIFLTDNDTASYVPPVPLNTPKSNHFIYRYNATNGTTTKLVEGAFLNFSTLNPIYGVNLLENLLFFTDNRNQPRKINVTNAGNDSTYYTTEDQISVAKYNPYKPIELIQEEVTGTGVVTLTTSSSTTATITSTTGNILVGAAVTGTSGMKDKKLRLEDAINATKAAVEEGIVPGGGTTLAHLAPALTEWANQNLSGEELIGANIVAQALDAPLKRIAENAGANGSVVAENVRHKPFSEGFNAASNEYVDMLAAGIIDPAKVTRSGLQNAASIAGMVLTTECIVVDLPEKKEAAPAGGGMGGGMGGDFDY